MIRNILRTKKVIPEDDKFIHKCIISATGSGKVSNILNDRQIILNELSKCDSWDRPELNQERIDCIRWLRDQINIEDLRQQYTIQNIDLPNFTNVLGKEITTILTYRQIHSISNVFKYLNNNNLPEAFHALVEFIDNYQYTLTEPLNDYEKLLIFIAIEQFEFVYKNNNEKVMSEINTKDISVLMSQEKLNNMSPAAKEKMLKLIEEFADKD